MKKLSLTLLLQASLALPIYSQSNWLDSTFANGGVFTQSVMYISCMLIQPDNKIMLGGSHEDTAYLADYTLLRLNSDGSIDSSFGNKGYMFDNRLSNNYAYWNNVTAIAEYNGKTILAGMVGGEDVVMDAQPYYTAVTRYNSNGSIDSSFGTNGIIIDYYDSIWPTSLPNLMIGSDGRIFLVATNYYSTPFSGSRVICYDSTGHIDSAFGVNGRISILINQLGFVYSSALQPDQKILIAGSDSTQTLFSMMRFSSSGSIDSTFGINGIARISCDSDQGGFNFAFVQNDSKILGTKYENTTQASDSTTFRLSRFTSSGTIDASFGQSGCAEGFSPYWLQQHIIGSSVRFVAEYPNGELLTAGLAYNDSLTSYGRTLYRPVLGFVRFMSDGRVDSSFAVNGVLTSQPLDFNQYDIPEMGGFALLPDGKFIASAYGIQIYKFLGAADNTGIITIGANKKVSIYPNPSTGAINISIDDLQAGYSVAIYDLLGQRISQSAITTTTTELNLSSHAPGTYLYHVSGPGGENISAGTFVIQ